MVFAKGQTSFQKAIILKSGKTENQQLPGIVPNIGSFSELGTYRGGPWLIQCSFQSALNKVSSDLVFLLQSNTFAT